MTFNEGLQIDPDRASSGGGPGMGGKLALGGGAGGLILLVIGLLLGGDPSSLLGQLNGSESSTVQPGTAGTPAHCKTGADANKYVECRVIATTNSVDGVWQQQLRGYTPPRTTLFHGQVQTGCGPATSDVGPFYCPVDKTAYFDTDFFQVLVDQFGSSGGPLAQEYVVAHEYGHHVQNLLGDLGRAQQDPEGATGGGVRTELQADCYAGVWAHYAAITKQQGTDVTFLEPLSDKVIADALSAASSVGDDRIQKEMTGRVNPESWTHGSSEQRQKWFTVGYQTGDAKKCDTFATNNLG